MVAQLEILETMTPLEFLSFRERLDAASGFSPTSYKVRDPEANWPLLSSACRSARRARHVIDLASPGPDRRHSAGLPSLRIT
jgi:tryptophan 2,3-dioxygenase